VSVRVASDRAGRPKGFAFGEVADESAASAATESLKGTQLHLGALAPHRVRWSDLGAGSIV